MGQNNALKRGGAHMGSIWKAPLFRPPLVRVLTSLRFAHQRAKPGIRVYMNAMCVYRAPLKDMFMVVKMSKDWPKVPVRFTS